MKRIEIAGRVVTFERKGALARVLVDGQPCPMRLRESESTLGNSGTSTKPRRAETRVDWAPLGGCIDSPDEFLVAKGNAGGFSAVCTWTVSRSHVYNTSVYEIERVDLQFDATLGSVLVDIDHHTDMSD